jgi:hypothetical protein
MMTTMPISEWALSKTLPKRQLRPLKYGDEIVARAHGGDRRSGFIDKSESGRWEAIRRSTNRYLLVRGFSSG